MVIWVWPGKTKDSLILIDLHLNDIYLLIKSQDPSFNICLFQWRSDRVLNNSCQEPNVVDFPFYK